MTPADYKAAREKLGLTQRELAEKLGVTRATMNAREAGRTQITEEAALAIAALQTWQPIEGAPVDGTPVLLFYPCEHGMKKWSVRIRREGDWNSAGQGWADEFSQLRKSSQPTHWAPLWEPSGNS